jgi:hypothetical protein
MATLLRLFRRAARYYDIRRGRIIWLDRRFIAIRRLQLFSKSEQEHGAEHMRSARERFWAPVVW